MKRGQKDKLGKDSVKTIGTVTVGECENVSTDKPWEPVTINSSPFSVVTNPNGFIFAHGSACGSLPTTSVEGFTYVADVYYFRRDKDGIDIDRYLGSITPTHTLAILKLPERFISYHHLRPSDPIISNLPKEKQEFVLGILIGVGTCTI